MVELHTLLHYAVVYDFIYADRLVFTRKLHAYSLLLQICLHYCYADGTEAVSYTHLVGKLARISGISPYTDGTFAQTQQCMEKSGIDHAVLLNIATAPGQEHTINACASEINRQPDFTALGSIHFLSENPVKEVHRIKELGLCGVKLHPDYQGFMIDDERLFPIYEACAEEGRCV